MTLRGHRARRVAPEGARHPPRAARGRRTGEGWVRYSAACAWLAAVAPVEVPPCLQGARRTTRSPDAKRPRVGPRWDSVAAPSGRRPSRRHTGAAPPYPPEPGWWHAHPALVDVATAAVGVAGDTGTLLVPVGYESVALTAPRPRRHVSPPAGVEDSTEIAADLACRAQRRSTPKYAG